MVRIFPHRPSTIAFLNPAANDGGNERTRLECSLKKQFPDVVIVAERIPDADVRHQQWANLLNGLKPQRVIVAGGDGTTTEVMSVLMNLSGRTVTSFDEIDELSPPDWLEQVSGIHGTGSAGDYDKTIGFPTLDNLSSALQLGGAVILPLGMAWALMPTQTPGLFDPQVVSHSLTAGFVAEHVFARRDLALIKWKEAKEEVEAIDDFAMARAFRDTLALFSESLGNRDIPWHLEKVRGRVLCFFEALLETIKARAAVQLGIEGPVDPLKHFDVAVTKNSDPSIHLKDVIDVDLFGLLMAAGGVGIPEAYPIAGPDFRMTLASVPNNMALGILMAVEGACRGSLAKLGCTSLIGPNSHFLTVQGAVKHGVMPAGHFQTLSHGDHVTIDFTRRHEGRSESLPVQLLRNGDVLPPAPRLRIAVGQAHQALPFVASQRSPLARVAAKFSHGPKQPSLLTRRTS